MLAHSPYRTLSATGSALAGCEEAGVDLQLQTLTGTEALSALYDYTLEFLTPADGLASPAMLANLDMSEAVGKALTVHVRLDPRGGDLSDMETRQISGIITDAAFVAHGTLQCAYRMQLRPWLCLAEHRVDYRIFQNKSVVDILDEVLSTYGYGWEKRLNGSYPRLTYQVQYGETDFAFLQRLMEEHGIYWFFEHAHGTHQLVIVDHPGAHRPVTHPAYRQLTYGRQGLLAGRDYLEDFQTDIRLQSGRWSTGDFDFEKPGAHLRSSVAKPLPTAHSDAERFEWPGDFVEPAHGELLARVRMEELHARGQRSQGNGPVRNVVCGTTFRLDGHPHDNANREYLVLSAHLHVSEPGGMYGGPLFQAQTRFDAQPAPTVFRPQRTIVKPRTRGPQTAIVTGPAGQDIWTDQYGRVKLKFHWDRSPVTDHNASCWVRVSYPWAGNNYGTISVPRVGSEVIVDFENGDPDRPLVTGRVFNAMNMPPWPLPEGATQSGTLTRSPRGGYETANAIRFEDGPGKEELWVHAERNHRVEVEADESHHVDGNRSRVVGKEETVKVGADQTVSVGGDSTHLIAGDLLLEVGTTSGELVAGAKLLLAGGGYVVVVGAAHELTVCGAMHVAVGAGLIENVGGARVNTAQGIYTMEAGLEMELKSGAARIILTPDGTIQLCGTVICPNHCG